MQMDLRSLLKEPSAERYLALDFPLPPDSGLRLQGNVSGDIILRHTGQDIVAMGHVGADVILECSRCLEDALVSVTTEIDAVCPIARLERQIAGFAVEPDADLDALFIQGRFQALELARQGLLTGLPLQPLCRPDCRGLCPQCGVNLNTEECSCTTTEVDPRLAGLQALLDRQRQE